MENQHLLEKLLEAEAQQKAVKVVYLDVRRYSDYDNPNTPVRKTGFIRFGPPVDGQPPVIHTKAGPLMWRQIVDIVDVKV